MTTLHIQTKNLLKGLLFLLILLSAILAEAQTSGRGLSPLAKPSPNAKVSTSPSASVAYRIMQMAGGQGEDLYVVQPEEGDGPSRLLNLNCVEGWNYVKGRSVQVQISRIDLYEVPLKAERLLSGQVNWVSWEPTPRLAQKIDLVDVKSCMSLRQKCDWLPGSLIRWTPLSTGKFRVECLPAKSPPANTSATSKSAT